VPSLGVAVIGAGDVAHRDYLPEFGRLAGKAHLSVVLSRREDRARGAAERFGALRWTTDLQTALGDDVDVVLNLTPLAAHREVTLAAIEAGKHVYTEKPLGRSPAEGAEIAQAAERAGVSVAAAPSVAVFPQVRRLHQIIAAGGLGEVVAVRAHACGGVPPWPGYASDPTPFFAADCGPLRDMGVYPLHAAVGLFGPLTRVEAVARTTVDGFTVPDGPHAGLRVPMAAPDDWTVLAETGPSGDAPHGVTVSVHANFSVREPAAPEFEVLGREGTATVTLLDVSAPIRLLARGAQGWTEEPVPHARADGGPDHLLGVIDLVDHVAEGAPLHIGIDPARHVLEVIEAAERSAGRRAAGEEASWPIHP
jgi:hypothetical protein